MISLVRLLHVLIFLAFVHHSFSNPQNGLQQYIPPNLPPIVAVPQSPGLLKPQIQTIKNSHQSKKQNDAFRGYLAFMLLCGKYHNMQSVSTFDHQWFINDFLVSIEPYYNFNIHIVHSKLQNESRFLWLTLACVWRAASESYQSCFEQLFECTCFFIYIIRVYERRSIFKSQNNFTFEWPKLEKNNSLPRLTIFFYGRARKLQLSLWMTPKNKILSL